MYAPRFLVGFGNSNNVGSWPLPVNYDHLSQVLRVCLKSHVVSCRTSYEETRGFLSYLSSHCENVEGATDTPKTVNHC